MIPANVTYWDVFKCAIVARVAWELLDIGAHIAGTIASNVFAWIKGER